MKTMKNRPGSTAAGGVVLLGLIFSLCVFSAGAQARVREGDPLPHFTGVDLEGQPFDTKQVNGKLLMLDFWSISCIACIEEMPHLVNLIQELLSRGVAFRSLCDGAIDTTSASGG